MSVKFNNEVTNRDLVDFDWDGVIRESKYVYDNVRKSIVDDILKIEDSNLIKFQINDIDMAIPPLHIGINKENLEYSWKTLRSRASTKIVSNTGVFNVQLTLLFPRECLLQLHRLILEIRNNPFVCIKNKYLADSLNSNEYYQLIKYNNTNLNNGIMKSTHFVVTNLQCVNYQSSPGAFLLELDLRIFNTIPYSLDLKYRHELMYLLNNNSRATIDVFFRLDSVDTKNPLKYYDRIINDVKQTQVKNLNGNQRVFLEINEKINSFGVDYPHESCIFVRYYNYIQIKHLYLNFGIDIKDLIEDYFANNGLRIDSITNVGNFKGYQDVFNIGLLNEDYNTSFRVLSIASKYLPTKVRNDVVNKMLADDHDFTLLYESYVTLNLGSEILTKIYKMLSHLVRYDVHQDDTVVEQNKKQIAENTKTLIGAVEADTNTIYTVKLYPRRKLSLDINNDNYEEVKVEFSAEEFSKLKSYFLATNGDFLPDFSALIDRRLNVFSTVEVVSLASAVSEEQREIEKMLLIKPLAVTSCSAMLTNSVAAIPIIGHTYPTYQFLGSHEPVYQLTFAAGSFGNDSEDIDSLPNGIRNLEGFRYEMEHNIRNFKEIPNSHTFSLNCFITKLFDSYRVSDIKAIETESGEASNNPKKLIKKRLSINAINTQTLEGSPGTTVGSLRFTETNNFDIEKLQLVYNDKYDNLEPYAKNILKLAKDYCSKNENNDPGNIYSNAYDIKAYKQNLVKSAIAEFTKQYSSSSIGITVIPETNNGLDPGSFFLSISLSEEESPFQQALVQDLLNFLKTKGLKNQTQYLGLKIENDEENDEDTADPTKLSNYKRLVGDAQNTQIELETIYKTTQNSRPMYHIYFNADKDFEHTIEDTLSYYDLLKQKTAPESKIDKLFKLICNFNILASSLLIEPKYYTNELDMEQDRIKNFFYNLYYIDIGESRTILENTIEPSYISYLMNWIAPDPNRSSEDTIYLDEIYAEPKETQWLNAYADAAIITTLISSALMPFANKLPFLAKLGLSGTTVLAVDGTFDLRRTRFAESGRYSTNFEKVNTYSRLGAAGFSAKKFLNKELLAMLDSNPNILEKIKEINSEDHLLFDILFRTSDFTELPDITASFVTKAMKLNPVIHLYSELKDVLDQDLVNSILLPDNQSIRANSLIFTGFEQSLLSYLYYFPRLKSTLLWVDNFSTDYKFYWEVFENIARGDTRSVKARDPDNTYQEQDQFRNLMTNPDWCLTFAMLTEDDLDKINSSEINTETNILINSNDILSLRDEIRNPHGSYLNSLLNRDVRLKQRIRETQENRLVFLQRLFNNLIVEALNEQKIQFNLQYLFSNKSEDDINNFVNGGINDERNGLDVSRTHCYPDIDLPYRPLTGNSLYLDPGFFYFDGAREAYSSAQKDSLKQNDIKIASAILDKSAKFMQELRKGNVYTGAYGFNIKEDLGRSKRERQILSKIPGEDDITIQDSLLADFQEGGAILEYYETLTSDLEESTTPDVPRIPTTEALPPKPVLQEAQTETEARLDKAAKIVKSGSTIYTSAPAEEADADANDRLNPQQNPLYGMKKQRDKEIAQDIKKYLSYNVDTQNSVSISDPNSDLLITGDRAQPNPSEADPINPNAPFFNTNFAIIDPLQNISDEDLKKYKNFLKNTMNFDADGTPSKELIIQSLSEQLGFFNKNTVSNIYPTFKFYIVEEDAFESDEPLVFDDFYSYNAVKDITIYKNRKLAADTAIVRLQNVSGSIDGSKPATIRDIDYEALNYKEAEAESKGLQSNNLNISSVLLRPGVSVQIRLGYSSSPNDLQVMLSGKITDLNWSSNGDMCEAVIQSFGTELLAKKIGTKTDGISDQFTFDNTDSVLKFMLHQTELVHFGRYKKGAQIDNAGKKNLIIRISNKKVYEKTWIESVQQAFSNNAWSLAAGFAIAGTTAAIVALKFPSVGRYIARGYNAAGQFLYQSRIVTGLTLFANKILFSGFSASVTSQLATIATSSTATAVATGGRFASILSWFTPYWYGWFTRAGATFQSLSFKVGFNQAVLRLLGTNAGSVAVTSLAQQSAFSLIGSSLFNGFFRNLLNVKLIGLAVGASTQLISSSLGLMGDGLSGLLNSFTNTATAKQKLDLAFSKVSIRLSPSDDCIFTPNEADYITGTSDGDQYNEEVSSAKYIVSNVLNTVIDIFLADTFYGLILNTSTGILNYKLSVARNAMNNLDSTDFKLEDTDEFKAITKLPYIAADKRLYREYGENKYVITNKTFWETLEEMTLRHPGWVTAARPYGLGMEYRVFFGLPNYKYFNTDISQSEIKRLEEIKKWKYEEVTAESAMRLLPVKYRAYINSYTSSKASLEQYNKEKLEYMKRLIVKDYNENIRKRMTTFRKYHYLSSDRNIVSLNIAVNDKAINAVDISYVSTNFSDDQAILQTRSLKAHPHIPDELINVATWGEQLESNQCVGYGAALRYGMSILLSGAKEMYDGEIITIGNASMNPHDVVLIEDNVNGISGPVEIEAVTHMFSFETGYLTEIKPNALVTANEAMTYPVTSVAPIFLATEQVVKRLSRKTFANVREGDTRNVDDTTKQEINNILNDYFNKDSDSGNINFWNDFVNNSVHKRLFSDNLVGNQKLEQLIPIIKEQVSNNIIAGFENNNLSTIAEMKQGLFQLPPDITRVLNLAVSDVAVVGSISAIFAAALNFFTQRATVERLSNASFVNFIAATKNIGKLGAIAATAAILFGDQVEPLVEEFMQNENTLNNVLNLTQETRFSKINDGTLLQIMPLYKNEKALLGSGFQYIRQNEIWHNRVGSIYNDISDAALGYIQAKKELRTKESIFDPKQLEQFVAASSNNPFTKLKIMFVNRYSAPDGETLDETEKDVIVSNHVPSGALIQNSP